MTADGDNTNFKTSLTQWGTALSVADQEKLKQLQTGIGEHVTLPKSRVMPATVGVDIRA